MNEQEMMNYILSCTYTRQDWARRISLFRAAIEYMMFSSDNTNMQDKLEAYITGHNIASDDALFLRNIPPAYIGGFSKENIYVLITALERMESKIPTLLISSAIPIPALEAEKMGKFVRRTIVKDAFVDFTVNPLIVCGCGISWKGIYYDFSLAYYINKNREKLASLVHK